MLKLSTCVRATFRCFGTQTGNKSDCIVLRDGYNIPLFGLGCYKLSRNVTEAVVLSALDCGYRLLDTAQSYENETYVGSAIKKCGVQRKNIYVVTKLSTKNGYEEAKLSCLESLRLLDLDYLDLYLIHSPNNAHVLQTWEAFLELQQNGFVRSIGVSNFNIHHLEPIRQNGLPLPVVNQIEHHPWYQKTKLIEYCRDNSIAVMGYCPLARKKCFDDIPLLQGIGSKYSKTERQVLLRWSVQKNIITIPKSSSPDRVVENSCIYDFCLSDLEMEAISNLNENLRVARVTALTDPWLG